MVCSMLAGRVATRCSEVCIVVHQQERLQKACDRLHSLHFLCIITRQLLCHFQCKCRGCLSFQLQM